jgi:hypothetical protein
LFGIIRPCPHRLPEGIRTQWMAHLCGLCLALRGAHGQFARTATNYDGLIVSVLAEAQAGHLANPWRTAGPCPLRGMRTASVAQGEGAHLAAAVSLVLASAKLRDHVTDGDGLLARRPVAAAARCVATMWERAGARTGAAVGFDTAVLLDAVGRQAGIEAVAGTGTPLLAITEPTEAATAAAFGHTAVLAGRPGNVAPLQEAGRLFGRLAHLLDAVEDLMADAASGSWNPVTSTGTGLEEVRRLCDDAAHGVRLALHDVDFAEKRAGRLVHFLLVHELPRAVDRVFGATCSHGPYAGGPYGPNPYGGAPHAPQPPSGPGSPYGSGWGHPYGGGPGNPYGGGPGGPHGPAGDPQYPRKRGLVAGCLAWTGLFCTCQVCCREEYDDPWRHHKKREGWCHKCDCDCDCDCDCCDCCDCSC